MRITYSKQVEAVYVYLQRVSLLNIFGVVKKTEGYWPIHFDYTKNNKLFGIEILESKRFFTEQTLKKIQKKDKVALLDMISDLKLFTTEDDEEEKSVKKVIDVLAKHWS